MEGEATGGPGCLHAVCRYVGDDISFRRSEA
jgi:hypothetical protein